MIFHFSKLCFNGSSSENEEKQTFSENLQIQNRKRKISEDIYVNSNSSNYHDPNTDDENYYIDNETEQQPVHENSTPIQHVS